jgi:hypothetical protein
VLRIPSALARKILSVTMCTTSLCVLILASSSVPSVTATLPSTVLLVLAEFPEYPHLASRSQISHIVFGTVGHYFANVSYGRFVLAGNVTDWITLPRVYKQYTSGSQFESGALARDAFSAASHSYNLTSFGFFVLVLSFYPSGTSDYISPKAPIITITGTVRGFSVLEEDSDWTAYARAIALSIGLWKVGSRISGLGPLDIASQGSGDMSAWSKRFLGWINDSQVLAYGLPPGKTISNIVSIEQRSTGHYAISIDIGVGQYFLEARKPIDYDQVNPIANGVVVLFIPQGNASISQKALLVPDSPSKSVFLDLTSDLAVVALNQTSSGFSVFIGKVQDGRDAQRTLYLLSQADSSIQAAEDGNRVAGLDLAQQLDNNAYELFSEGRFQEAAALATSAQTTAQGAVVPPDYSQSVTLIAQAESLATQVQGLSSHSSSMVSYGNSQLQLAKASFIAKNFTIARQQAQTAIDAYNRAKQIALTDAIFGWVSDASLIFPVILLAIVLRYQLRNG